MCKPCLDLDWLSVSIIGIGRYFPFWSTGIRKIKCWYFLTDIYLPICHENGTLFEHFWIKVHIFYHIQVTRHLFVVPRSLWQVCRMLVSQISVWISIILYREFKYQYWYYVLLALSVKHYLEYKGRQIKDFQQILCVTLIYLYIHCLRILFCTMVLLLIWYIVI